MRSKFAAVLSLIVALSMVFTSGLVSAGVTPIQVTVNGKAIKFPDEKPFKDKSGRVQVPVRFLAEALDVKVSWNEKDQIVAFTKEDGLSLSMGVGQDWYDMRGMSIQMDTAATKINGRVFAPIRFISEAFEVGVIWDSRTNTVILGGKPESSEKIPKVFMNKLPGGLTIPSNTMLSHVDMKGAGGALVTFTLELKSETTVSQKKDLRDALLKVFDVKTVDFVIGYMEGTNRKDFQSDTMYYESTVPHQWIKVFDLKNNSWEITVYKEGFKPAELSDSHNPASYVNVVPATTADPLRIGVIHQSEVVRKELSSYSGQVLAMYGDFIMGNEQGTVDFNRFVDKNVVAGGRTATKNAFVQRIAGQLDGLDEAKLKSIGEFLQRIGGTNGTIQSIPGGNFISTHKWMYTLDKNTFTFEVQFHFSVYDEKHYALKSIHMF